LTILHFIHRVAHDFDGGIEGLVSFMNLGRESKLSTQMLTNKLNFNSNSHHLYIEEAEQILDRTNRNLDAARFYAEKANAVVMALPVMPDDGDMGMLDIVMSSMKELGEVFSVFQTAYADGNITQREFSEISSEIDDVIVRLLELKAAVKRVTR